MKAKAAVVWGPGEPWTVEEIEVDPPGPGEVLVEWAASGLCHSDEHFRSGDRVPAEIEETVFPLLGGHEGAGIVSQVGPGVTELAVGDHVVASFAPTCGKCRYCTSGRAMICDANRDFMAPGQLVDGAIKHRVRGRDLFVMAKLGTFAERTTVSVNSVIRIDADIPLDAACLVSCGVPTGWGSAVVRGGVRPGDVVAVVGLGGLGISAVQGARLAGAAHIVAIDPFESRRDSAAKLGATRVAASIEDARPDIAHLTNGQGADVVVLTPSVVTGEILAEGLSITGKGCVCVSVGMGELGQTPVPIDIGMFSLLHKEIRGSLFGGMNPRSAPVQLLGLYRDGLLDLDAMITTYPLDDINTALADTSQGRVVRAVVRMGAAS
ncbi:NDMA-dependent alcohol dehydrogenase [Nocardioides sp. BP30]|uniref:NDMA-dependent alcohol dehydrogenase n=1 Tax=Nocardioides sp. BP30 TaxID=3036374 RepID=UPI0024698BEC|nr:NDMA-dependent alcohol dehydrogenase [Nocardioides sp. BP30]WGL54127.1 NDMA-dependent alcohol dehydrogenase [Nocardioides sp. BP30]